MVKISSLKHLSKIQTLNTLPKVFGSSNFAKPRTVVPLFVEERFQALLNYGWRKGFIRGLNCELTCIT
jgi:hypothetical protein